MAKKKTTKKKLDANFSRALKIILREEGGNDDDPHDHGGRTSRGIIQREWDAFRRMHPGRPADVWEASDEDVALIYSGIPYWRPYAILMPTGVDLCYFNASVNSGPKQATRELQRCLPDLDDDGVIGVLTLAAIHDISNPSAVVDQMCERRRRFYRSLAQCPRYCRGWLARTDRVERDARLIIAGKMTVAKIGKVEPAELGRAKAYPMKQD